MDANFISEAINTLGFPIAMVASLGWYINKKDKEKAAHISQRHMSRYSENIDAIRKMFPEYFND